MDTPDAPQRIVIEIGPDGQLSVHAALPKAVLLGVLLSAQHVVLHSEERRVVQPVVMPFRPA